MQHKNATQPNIASQQTHATQPNSPTQPYNPPTPTTPTPTLDPKLESLMQWFSTPLTPQQRLLIEQHTPYALGVATQCCYDGVTVDEVSGDAYYGLCLAAQRYKEQPGASFSTFAYHFIRSAVMRNLRERQAALDSSTHASHLDIATEPSLVAAEREQMQSRLHQELQAAIERLSSDEQHIVRLHYGLDGVNAMTLSSIAEALGLSYHKVRKLNAAALQHLRHDSRLAAAYSNSLE